MQAKLQEIGQEVIMSLPRRIVAEGLGTAFLLAVVIGSGIMGERLAGGNVAIALLANSLATGGGLVVLILIFGPVSGAHFNPAVTLAAATQGVLPWREVLALYRRPSAGSLCRGGGGPSACSGSRSSLPPSKCARAARNGGASLSRPLACSW